jgi:hypothetical protein
MKITDWAAVVSGFGTLGAVLVSLFLLQRDQQDRRQRREDAKRAQAGLFTAWCDWEPAPGAVDAAEDPLCAAVFVRNGSDLAILDVFVDYWHPHRGGRIRDVIGPVPPGATRHKVIEVVPPDSRTWEPASLLPSVYFADSAGQRWYRDPLGRLRTDWGPGSDGPWSHPPQRASDSAAAATTGDDECHCPDLVGLQTERPCPGQRP